MEDTPLCPNCGTPLLTGHGVCPGCTARLALGLVVDPERDFDGTDLTDGPRRVGTYDLEAELGRGTMGVVFRARDRRLGRAVALKVVLAGRFASSAERQRFVLEAEAAARLDHPNIVTIYESGDDEGRPFFAMRLVDGATLADRLSRGAVPPREAAAWLTAIARAVQHAHERGVLHRDLKPGNVLLDAQGVPHVADFGLARQVDRDSSLTLAGSPLGTPGYMAPEAANGEFSAAADVWSLGVIFYEMLAGAPPFLDASLTGVLLAVRERDPPPLRPRVPGLDRDLENICLRCLEKNPAHRYRSAADLADDLDRWQTGLPVRARPVTRGERLVKWMRRRPAIAALSLLAVTLAAAGIAGVLWQWRRADREAASARAALGRAEESLWQANADRARALRGSRTPGQRIDALAALREAAAHRPSRELRDEAIAALALPDLTPDPGLASPFELPPGASIVAADGALKNIAWSTSEDAIFSHLADGSEWARLPMPGLGAGSMVVSQDFRRAALIGSDGLRVVDVPTGAVVWQTPGARAAAFASAGDGIFVVTSEGAVETHSLPTGRRSARREWKGGVSAVRADPAGGRLAAWRGNAVVVLAPPGLEIIAEFENLPSWVMDIGFNPGDGTLLAGLDSTGLVQFDPATQSGRVIARHDREGVVPFVHPGGLLMASTSWDGMAKFSAPWWGELLHATSLRPVAFSADGNRLLAQRDRRLRLATLTPPDVWRPLALGPHEARGAAFSPDGRWLAVSYWKALALWDLETGRPVARVPVDDGRQLDWDADGSLWVALGAQGLGRFTLTPADPPVLVGPETLVPADGGDISSFARLAGDRIATNGSRLTVWQWPERRRLRDLDANPCSDVVRASPDGRRLAAGCWANNGRPNSFVGVWDPEVAAPAQRIPAGNADVFFSPDSRRCVVGEISGYREYDTTTWQPGREWPRPSSGLDAARAAWSADGQWLCLQADEHTLRLLDAATGTEQARLASPVPRRIERFSFSRDGHHLVVISTGAVQLWNLELLRRHLREMGLDWE